MIKALFCFFTLVLNFSTAGFAGDENPPITSLENRYEGRWQGNWLEGMSSGKAALEVTESGAQMSLSSLPVFGAAPISVTKLTSDDKQLKFTAVGADGRSYRFDLKPSSNGSKLIGKAFYDSLHMELELARAK